MWDGTCEVKTKLLIESSDSIQTTKAKKTLKL